MQTITACKLRYFPWNTAQLLTEDREWRTENKIEIAGRELEDKSWQVEEGMKGHPTYN